MSFEIKLTDGTVVVVPGTTEPEQMLGSAGAMISVTDTTGTEWRINRDHIVSITEQPDQP